MALSNVCPTLDVRAIAQELARHFPVLQSGRRAEQVAEFANRRLQRENNKFNALLLTKILTRLEESKNNKIVAASLAFAVKISPIFLRRQMCLTPRDAARVLEVRPSVFIKEIEKSKQYLNL